jgi:hypothetical protein
MAVGTREGALATLLGHLRGFAAAAAGHLPDLRLPVPIAGNVAPLPVLRSLGVILG